MTLHAGHIGLNVTDLDRSLAFYRDVLGFTLLAEGKEDDDRRYAYLGDGGDHPVLTLWQQAQGPYGAGHAGLHHLAFAADSVEQVERYEAALKAYGADFAYEGVVAHREGAASGGIFFHDPDGTRLEISVPSGAEHAPAPHAEAPTCGFF
ncbi:VOC family protein [Streptomyces hokutonensis]|uniref:VOC family protein n=1 Tax=Streptomyces hokutonensis TaxID=1306990 RepID=UPI000373D570|nr:VOC family protein [Streptomyces hokutonensis]